MHDTKRLIAGIIGLLAIAVFSVGFLYAQKPSVVLLLVAGGALGTYFSRRSSALKLFGDSFRGAPARSLIIVALCAAAGIALVFRDTPYVLMMISTVLLFIVVCIGINIQTGYCGLLNFAGAAFFGIGCYAAAILCTRTTLPPVLIIVCCGAIAGVIGLTLILPVLRTHGYYASLVTIAFGILFRVFLEANDALGGPQGLKVPGMTFFGWNFNNDIEIAGLDLSFVLNYFVLSLLLAAFALWLTFRIERSWIGLNMDAIRLDETAASVFGLDIARWKAIAFTLGNFLCGIAGAVYAMLQGFIAPANFTLGDSLTMLSIVILGGIGNPVGVLPAAAIMVLLPEKLQFIQEYRFLLYGALIIFILLFRPQGLMPRRLRKYFAEQPHAPAMAAIDAGMLARRSRGYSGNRGEP